jgi:prepilin-type N-terminal cleavage/methylation domain-containing protein
MKRPRTAQQFSFRAGCRSGRRAGFTLVEVLVALSIAGMLLVGARALLTQLVDGAARIGEASVGADRDANAERFLRALLLQVEANDGESIRFIGDERAARFVSWCTVPAGWQERCTATLGVVPVENGIALTVLLHGGEMIVVRRGARSGELRYLYSAGEGGTWLPTWRSVITTPLAVGILLDGDTLVLRIGERG